MEIVVPKTAYLAQLDEFRTAPNLFNGAEVHLYKTALSLGPNLQLADLVEADFDGYAGSGAVTWNAASYSPDGKATLVGDLKSFVATGPFTTGNTIYGYYVTNGAGTALLWARQFATPIAIGSAGQSVQVLPSYPAFTPAA
jgi:hypothetical protein